MRKSVKAILLCISFVSVAVPVCAAVQLHAPISNAPQKSAWRPLTNAEYQRFLRNPDFALADKNLRLIWRDAQRQLPLNRLEIIRKQQEDWEKTGRDRDAENKCWGDVTEEKRRNAYTEAILLRSQWLWNKFGSFKVGHYEGAEDGYATCGWIDYERRTFYYEFRRAGGNWSGYGRLDSRNRLLAGTSDELILHQNHAIIANGHYPIKIFFGNQLSTGDWPGANY